MTSNAAQALEVQAGHCAQLGSPLSAGLLIRAAADIRSNGVTAGCFAPWADAEVAQHFRAATPLRWLGAMHDLALAGEPALAAAYHEENLEAAWLAALAAMTAQPDSIAAFMDHEPQTNEVGRSACLMLGFLDLARRFGMPLRTVELGASAGLNQIWDRYGYDLGGVICGDRDSPVQLTPQWRTETRPEPASPNVSARAACDRRPLDLARPDVRRRLMAYVWAYQHDRLARLKTAIDLAVAASVSVEAEDAAAFAEARGAPQPGVVTVIYHSVFWQYLPALTQTRLRAAIEAHGAWATPAAPLAWLRMESDPALPAEMEIRLTIWPAGEERRLARSHAHGGWIEYGA